MPLINGFSGNGGGSGKIMQQFTLPTSYVYEETGSAPEWELIDTAAQSDMSESWYEDGMIYKVVQEAIGGVTKVALYEQNGSTFETVKEVYPHPNASENCRWAFVYNHDVYVLAYYPGGSHNMMTCRFAIYKFNRATKTTTKIITYTFEYNNCVGTWFHGKLLHKITDHCFGGWFISGTSNAYYNSQYYRNGMQYQYLYYDFLTNEIGVVAASDYGLSGASTISFTSVYGDHVQRTQSDVRFLFPTIPLEKKTGTIFSVSLANPKAKPAAYTAQSGSLFELSENGGASTQIGDKLIYCTNSIVFGGKKTGELDLRANTSIDPTKYPEVPGGINTGLDNMHLIDGKIVIQSTGKAAILELIPKPPQNKPLVLQLFKGDCFNALFKDIDVVALKDTDGAELQPAFTISRQQQTADRDYEVHLSQYDLQGTSTPITVIKP